MKTPLLVLLLSLAPAGALAAPALCDLATGQRIETENQTKAVVAANERLLASFDEWRKFIGSRQWKDGVPMGEQMTSAESVKFGELRQKQMSAQIAALYESKRMRDIRVISRMAVLSDKVARYGLEIPSDQASEDFTLLAILSVFDQFHVVKDEELANSVAATTPCSLEIALLREASRAIAEGERVEGLDEAIRRINQLAAQFGKPIDPKKLPPAVRQEYENTLVPIVRKGMAFGELAANLYRLSLVEAASKKMLQAWHQDQYESPGDIKYTGTTWERWRKDGKVTETDHKMSGVINVINEKIPADAVKMMDTADND